MMVGRPVDDDPPGMIEAILPRGAGHQFVFYGDACSGVAGAEHEATFARTNAAVAQLSPEPEFIVFAGDEIVGLTTDEAELRAQWRYWLDVEMAWLDRERIPLYNTTSNHSTYDLMSERVFADVLDHLPDNGPPGQQRLSYLLRRDDLLLVVAHTSWSGLGGEGHVDTDWLDEALGDHADARFKIVAGHHPVFPVNGFVGEYQRELGRADGKRFWEILVRHGVSAYLCSHILAFDVQVHDGVLQVLSAGAGTAHRMPEGVEYLHFVQGAVDSQGLRYQVIDQLGGVRERLDWPLLLSPSHKWSSVPGTSSDPSAGLDRGAGPDQTTVIGWRFSGVAADDGEGQPQTLLAARPDGTAQPPVWIGLTGVSNRLTVTMSPQPRRSPHYWFGHTLQPGQRFDFQLVLHPGMGPGGVLKRSDDASSWSSLASSSEWGFERFTRPLLWIAGNEQTLSPQFRGGDLSVTYTTLPIASG